MGRYPPGTIGIISGELGRWTVFYQSLLAYVLKAMPPESQIIWCRSQWIAGAINEIVAQMWPSSTWFSVIADDHVWDPDLYYRLLERQVDIVSPLVHLRRHPLPPSLFHALPDGNYQCYDWAELEGKSGLLAVDTFGGPCSVIRREVLAALGDPWFQCQPGQLVYPHEDLYFFNRARLAGYQPYVDLDQSIWHCFAAMGRPTRLADGTYGIRIAGDEELGLLKPEPQGVNTAATYHAYT